MKQSRLMSLIEAKANIAVGLVISYVSNMVVLPLVLGHRIPHTQLGLITAIYTVLSLARSYAIRRWFAGRTG